MECHAGDSLPLKVSIKGDFLSWESSQLTPIDLTILQTCYIRCIDCDHFLFSKDGLTWKEFIEFFTGNISAGLEIERGELQANLQCEFNQRKE